MKMPATNHVAKGVKLKKIRPKSKTERLNERQQWLLSFNQNNFDDRKVQINEDEHINRGNKKLKKTAKAEIEQLFKDLNEGELDDEEADDCDKYEKDNEDLLAFQNSDQYNGLEDKDSNEITESLYADKNDRLESDDDTPPTEFSSTFYNNSNVTDHIAETKLKERHKQRKKVSKKKRDVIKQKHQLDVDNGVYRVQKGATQFEIISLEKSCTKGSDHDDYSEIDEEDEGSLMCPSSLLLINEPKNNEKIKRKILSSSNIGFREQLLRISTASKRKKKHFWRIPNEKNIEKY